MISDAKDMTKPIRDALKRLGRSLAEFFTPRDWVPTIPIPRKCEGKGCMTLSEAIQGFPEEARERAR